MDKGLIGEDVSQRTQMARAQNGFGWICLRGKSIMNSFEQKVGKTTKTTKEILSEEAITSLSRGLVHGLLVFLDKIKI